MDTTGYEVQTATSAAEGLAIIAADPDGLDLVLSDHSMPGKSGVELIRKVLEARPTLPTLLMTGYLGAGLDEELSDHGALRIIQKPFTMADILRAIRTELDERGTELKSAARAGRRAS
jgi:DNA-binding NtrC family response regulator